MLGQHFDLVPQRLAVDDEAVGQVHPHLAFQRQVVQVLGDGHVDREFHRIPPALYEPERSRRCHWRAAMLAAVLLSSVLAHHEVPLHHRDLLGILRLTFPLGQRRAAVGTHAVGLDQFVRVLFDGQLGLLARPVTIAWRTRHGRLVLPIAAYKKLYEIEAKVRDLSDDQRKEIRQAESKPVWNEICAWCDTYKPHEPPSSKLGEAIRYLTNHRIPLGRFLEDGVIPIDNGIVERLHVRAALTRKNFLFAGSDAGGERAAIAYTILGCCRLAKVNPVEYLADVLPRLARRVRLRDMYALMPARWHRSEPAAAVTPGPVAAQE